MMNNDGGRAAGEMLGLATIDDIMKDTWNATFDELPPPRSSPSAAAAAPSSSSEPTTLIGQLRAALHSRARADVALQCQGQLLPAHSFLLTLRSPVVSAQLAPGSPLACQDRAAVPVPAELTPATLQCLLEWLYTDELSVSNAEEARTCVHCMLRA